MSYSQKNWRGLPVHPVDPWDSWQVSLDEYQEMQLTYELLADTGTDMGLVFKLAEYSARAQRLTQYEMEAGENI